MSNRMVNLWSNELDQLRAVERAARLLITDGLSLRGMPPQLVVLERDDKTDPHYRLCEALEVIAPLNPKPGA